MKKKILTAILVASTAFAFAASMAGCETPSDNADTLPDGTQQEGSINGSGNSQNNNQNNSNGNVQNPDNAPNGGAVTPAPVPPPHNHTYENGYTFDKYSHWHASSCGHEEEILGKAVHNLDENGCTVCDFKYTQGLEYDFNSKTNKYTVTGIGSAQDSVLIIPPAYNGFPVISVGYNAFNGCTQLTRVIMPDGDFLNFGEYAFANCPNLTSVELPANLAQLYRGNFENCTKLKSITLPEALTHIGDDAFVNCGITELYIPKNVFGIAYNAFHDSNIQKLTVDPANPYMWSDGNCIMDNRSNKGDVMVALKTAVIPASAKNIGGNAFYDCKGLTSIDIPANINAVKSYAFFYCRDLTEVSLHVGLAELQSGAFTQCTNLKDIRFDGTTAQWNAITKASDWAKECGNYTIHCTDGQITI